MKKMPALHRVLKLFLYLFKITNIQVLLSINLEYYNYNTYITPVNLKKVIHLHQEITVPTFPQFLGRSMNDYKLL